MAKQRESKTRKKKEKTPAVVTKRREYDSGIDLQIKKSPTETRLGKVLIYLLVAGTLLIPLALLIFFLVQALK